MANRSRIITAFRNLHRARKQVFDADPHALNETRQKINQEFRKHLMDDQSKIEEGLTLASDVAKLLRMSVVQLNQKDAETFELRVTKDTAFAENTPFDPTRELPLKPRKKKGAEDIKASPALEKT